MSGRLLARFALQIAENDRNAIAVRQPAELFVEQGLQIVPDFALSSCDGRHVGHLFFPRPASAGELPCFERGLVSDAVEPVGHHLPRDNGVRFAKQDQIGCLKSVLGVVVIENAAAHGPGHRAVPPHKSGNRRFVAALDEALQQLPVGAFSSFPHEGFVTQVLNDLADPADGHFPSLARVPSSLLYYYPHTPI